MALLSVWARQGTRGMGQGAHMARVDLMTLRSAGVGLCPPEAWRGPAGAAAEEAGGEGAEAESRWLLPVSEARRGWAGVRGGGKFTPTLSSNQPHRAAAERE